MNVSMELWQLITLLLAFFGAVWAFGKVLMTQFDKQLDIRFRAQDKAREDGSKALREKLDQHLEQELRTAEQLKALERDFLLWKADMPVLYVRREDYVRNQTVIEAKLDAVALRIENIQLKGNQR